MVKNKKIKSVTTTATKTSGGDKTSDFISRKEKLILSKTVGGNISQSPLEFTKDSNIATGAAVKTLSRSSVEGSHKDKVTCVLLNPKNPLQLLSASLDGTIKLWDYNDDVLLKTFDVNLPIEQLILLPSDPEHAYLLVTPNTKDKTLLPKKTSVDDTEMATTESMSKVYQYRLDTSTTTATGNDDDKNRTRLVVELNDCSVISLSADGKYLAMGTRFILYIWPINYSDSDVSMAQFQSYTFQEGITQLAFSPTSTFIAVGQRTGRITFYHYGTENTRGPVTESHHWHSTPVRALKFMDDGNYLLSGGGESVLVVWQLGTGFRRYFPRIGGEISFINITPDYKHFCVSLGDNSIRLINGVTQTVEQVIQGVQQWDRRQQQLELQEQQQDRTYRTCSTNLVWAQGMMVEPRNHHLVLNGAPGSIQFYDSKVDHHALELEIIPNNRNVRQTSQNNAATTADRGHVAMVAFSSNGEWMATVDMRNDQITTIEVYLKFWHWDHDQQTYILHTRVDRPHTEEITSLCFHPSASFPMAITTSMDKTFKVWHLSSQLGRAYNTTISDANEVAWTCRSVGVYRNFWPSASAFSADGSMLTVAFGPVVTVWDPYQNTIQGTLSTSEVDYIKSLHFINDSPYLVSKSKSHLFVWNLLTCTVWWSYQMQARYVSVDPRKDRFVAVVKDDYSNISQLVLFEPSSPQPLLVQALNFVCQGVAWIPSTLDSHRHHDVASDDSNGKNNNTGDTVMSFSDLAYLQPNHTIKIMSVVKATKLEETMEQEITIGSLPSVEERKLFNDAYGSRQQRKTKDALALQSRIHANTLVRNDAVRGKSTERKGPFDRHDQIDGDIFNVPSHILPRVDAIFGTFMDTLMDMKLLHENHVDEKDELDNSTGMDWTKTDRETVTSPSKSTNAPTIVDTNIKPALSSFSVLEPLPSLDVYFADLTVECPASVSLNSSHNLPSSSSSDESSDEDEDVDNIDW
ncbi:WD40-repeat-containing domain protein [Chlamydoabsidia padenii]|nr:WD40-repeat-containing domain protein [Chlamydoabsidia padenii]